MESIYRNFYRRLYIQTGGFLPTLPHQLQMYPGDFFQIRNGELILLGNIFRNGIIDKADVKFSAGIKLNPSGWQFGNGVSKAFSSRGTGDAPLGGQFQFSQQILAFRERSSFLFSGHEPESVKIQNWDDIQQQLIIRMTQGLYSFRELYIVSESASLSGFSIAVAGAQGAELEIATDTENFGLVDIFGHHSARTIQSKDIEYYHRELHRKPAFYKARKLAVKDDRKRIFMNDLVKRIQYEHEGLEEFFGYSISEDQPFHPEIQTGARECLLDMLSANELNPNTALSYFTWGDTNLDDVEKLFLNYESN